MEKVYGTLMDNHGDGFVERVVVYGAESIDDDSYVTFETAGQLESMRVYLKNLSEFIKILQKIQEENIVD